MAERRNPFQTQHTVLLPVSQAKVRVRRPSLMTMVTVSGLPSELTAMAMRVASGQRLLDTGDEVETMKTNFGIIEAFIPYVLVDLKITKDGPTDVKEDEQGCWIGTVNIADLADTDKQYLFMYGRSLVSPNEPEESEATTEEVGKFRDGANSSDAGSSGEAVRPAPIESSGHPVREPVGA